MRADELIADASYEEYGVLVNSGDFRGLSSNEAKLKIAEYMEESGIGKAHGEFSFARLVFVAPALLGLPDSRDLLRRWHYRNRAGRSIAGFAAHRRAVHRQRRQSAAFE